MKKILLAVFTFLALSVPGIVKANSWTVWADTVYATVDSNYLVEDTILVTGSSTYALTWHVIASDFPPDWLTLTAFGACDNNQCYNNTSLTNVWNGTTGSSFTSNPYSSAGPGDFHLLLNLKGVSTGTHYMTINLQDPSLSAKTATFIINKPVVTGVTPVMPHTDEVILYPNPATNELNVVYDASADVKNIAVYNIIGKALTVYKVTANNSANLNLENLPSGIYFARLINSQGNVVVTRKFTKQ